jgi:predicted  nucleic acid-binding Zn-ribbon protein
VISPHSKAKVWWRCRACGHSWPATVQNRAGGHGCPRCGLERRARTQSRVDYDRSLAALHPDLLEELHPSQPGHRPGSAGRTVRPQTVVVLRNLRSRVAGRRL